MKFSAPVEGKRSRVFFWSAAVNGYVHAPPSIVVAFQANAFEYDDKIELLMCKRIDMTDTEFAGLPMVNAEKISRRGK